MSTAVASANTATAIAPWKPTFNQQELVAIGEGTFLEGLTKLPRGLMLLFDRIMDAQPAGGAFGKGFIQAELDINALLWFFKYHFKDDPVMPGSLGLDALWQLVGFFMVLCGARGKGRAIGAAEIKFSGEILPSHKLVTYRVDIKRLVNGGTRRPWVAFADGNVTRDGEVIYKATDLQVGVFPKPAA